MTASEGPREILVTGALDQIGSEFIPPLGRHHDDDRVIATDLRSMPAGAPAAAGPHEHLDCTEPQQLQELVRRYDIGTIRHLAALLSATAMEPET